MLNIKNVSLNCVRFKGANGQKNSNITHSQPTRLPVQSVGTTDISGSRKSNAQWSRTPKPTSQDNVNGFSDNRWKWRDANGGTNRGANGGGRRDWQPQRYSRLSGANGVPVRNLRQPPSDLQPNVAAGIVRNDNALDSTSTPAVEETRLKPYINGLEGKNKSKSKSILDEADQRDVSRLTCYLLSIAFLTYNSGQRYFVCNRRY